jgi:hypothetical protein
MLFVPFSADLETKTDASELNEDDRSTRGQSGT